MTYQLLKRGRGCCNPWIFFIIIIIYDNDPLITVDALFGIFVKVLVPFIHFNQNMHHQLSCDVKNIKIRPKMAKSVFVHKESEHYSHRMCGKSSFKE